MTTWVTADLHFGHANILKFNPATRPFANEHEMNEKMVREWNAIVHHSDITYILGDVAFCNATKAVTFMKRLNGKKILIQGNHDYKLVKDPEFASCFEEIHLYHEIVFEKTKVCMFHYPIFDHNQSHHGSIMLHGHRHGTPHNIPGRIMDVGMDATGEIVSNLSEVIKTLLKKPTQSHH
jgi:calcineurin-like phosphoesterase family protein